MLKVVNILRWYKTHGPFALETNVFEAGDEHIRRQRQACSALDANAFGAVDELG